MKVKYVIYGLVLFGLIIALSYAVRGATIYADDYSSIQEAINATSKGDTIIVNGTAIYSENVIINKEINLCGNPDNPPTIYAMGGVGISIEANNTLVENFTVYNCSTGIYVHNDSFTIINVTINNTTVNYADIGIHLEYSSNNNITNCTVYHNLESGIFLEGSSNNNIIGNNVSGNPLRGIFLNSSNSNDITGNNVSNNSFHGIHLYYSSNNNITGNNASDNSWGGIYLYSSSNNTLTGNNAFNNSLYGISLYYSSNTTLTNNTMYNNGLLIEGDDIEHWNTHNIDTSNLVNGKPLYYYKNQDGGNVSSDAGQVILANCTNFTISNLTLNNCLIGISLGFSSSNNITGNIVSDNSGGGIYLFSSSNNNITGNNVSVNNAGGVALRESNNNSITGNNVSGDGIGIYLYYSSNTTLTNNTMYNNGLLIEGDDIEHWNTHNIDTSNLVNGKPLYYYKNQDGGNVSSDAGQVILANCTNFTISNLTLNNCLIGISLGFSSSNNITGSNVSDNYYGIFLYNSSNNLIYNNYFNNTQNRRVWGNCSGNIWNTTKTTGTNIVGGPYLGGNYWSDYTGIDKDHDGFGDTQYNISETDIDLLPLVISPDVVSTSPTNGSTSVSISTNIVINFNKPMNKTATQNNFSISPSVTGTFTWSNNNTTLTFDPASSLSYGTKYTVTIGWNAEDLDGNVMTRNYTFSFTTESAPSGGGGGGAPPADTTPPSTPTNVRCTSPINDNTPSFAWNASTDESGIAGYYVKIDNGTEISVGDVLAYTFTTPVPDGTHTFYVRAKDNYGNYGSYGSCTFVINTSTPTNEPPIANANGPYHGLTNRSITFDGSASYDPDGTIVNYTWDFGDGSYGYGVKPTHAYNTSGTFNVTLTVKDDQGLTSSNTTYAIIEQDTDGDGLSDELEELLDTDPNTPTTFVEITIEGTNTYLVDLNNDNMYDILYNIDTNKTTALKRDSSGNYLIDYDGDGKIDYIYNPSTGQISSYEEEEKPSEIPWNIIIVVVIVIVVVAAVIAVIYIRRFSF